MPPRFAIYTLGCKVNQYDSFAIARELALRGWTQVGFDEDADAYIIDTCTVTGVADRKSRKAIRRATSAAPNALVVVTGCAAERSAEALRQIKGVKLVIGNQRKQQLADELCRLIAERRHAAGENEGEPAATSGFSPEAKIPSAIASPLIHKPRFLLKIQDGCNRRCSYCIVPSVRGKSRSRPVREVLAEAHTAVEQGAREVVLTGIQLGDYGLDLPEGRRALLQLITSLHEIEPLARIRFSSILPQDITADLLTLMANSPKVCQHLHIPLQSGSDAVLRQMRRGYTSAQFLEIIRRARRVLPDLAVTTDVMVGFPGETEEDFLATVSVAEKVRFSRMHIFQFSPRPGTKAAEMPEQIPSSLKEQRSSKLFALAEKLATEFASKRLGKLEQVLLESVAADGRTGVGYTGTYIRTVVRGADMCPGELVTVMPRQWSAGCLIADAL